MCLPYLLLSIETLLYILAVYCLVTFGAVLILCSVAILTFYKFITLSSHWLQHMHAYHTSYKALGKIVLIIFLCDFMFAPSSLKAFLYSNCTMLYYCIMYVLKWPSFYATQMLEIFSQCNTLLLYSKLQSNSGRGNLSNFYIMPNCWSIKLVHLSPFRKVSKHLADVISSHSSQLA